VLFRSGRPKQASILKRRVDEAVRTADKKSRDPAEWSNRLPGILPGGCRHAKACKQGQPKGQREARAAFRWWERSSLAHPSFPAVIRQGVDRTKLAETELEMPRSRERYKENIGGAESQRP
jgi:hypothetical protein